MSLFDPTEIISVALLSMNKGTKNIYKKTKQRKNDSSSKKIRIKVSVRLYNGQKAQQKKREKNPEHVHQGLLLLELKKKLLYFFYLTKPILPSHLRAACIQSIIHFFFKHCNHNFCNVRNTRELNILRPTIFVYVHGAGITFSFKMRHI